MLEINQYTPLVLSYNQSELLCFFSQNMSQFDNNNQV